jgi:hypothetical protein
MPQAGPQVLPNAGGSTGNLDVLTSEAGPALSVAPTTLRRKARRVRQAGGADG